MYVVYYIYKIKETHLVKMIPWINTNFESPYFNSFFGSINKTRQEQGQYFLYNICLLRHRIKEVQIIMLQESRFLPSVMILKVMIIFIIK